MRTWTLLAYVFLGGIAHAQDLDVSIARAAIGVWERCIVEKAKQFAKSPEPATFVIDLVMKFCDDEKRAAAAAIARTGVEPHSMGPTLKIIAQQIQKAASEAILETRSKR